MLILIGIENGIGKFLLKLDSNFDVIYNFKNFCHFKWILNTLTEPLKK